MLKPNITLNGVHRFCKHSRELRFEGLQSVLLQLAQFRFVALAKRPMGTPLSEVNKLFIQRPAPANKTFLVHAILQTTTELLDADLLNVSTFLLH